jgi:zeaxanthin glucosyltransferase
MVMHFGIISPPVHGHIHPLCALGRVLKARGHRVTFLQLPDLEEKIRSEGIEFRPIGDGDFPKGSLPHWLDELGRRRGLAAIRFTIAAVARTSGVVCREAPAAIRNTSIDAMLVDQMEPAGGAVAEYLRLPFVTVCNALAINHDPQVPPPFSPWKYSTSSWSRWRNEIGYTSSNWLTRPIRDLVARFRAEWKLPPLASPDESFSPLAQICQMPREFDFPRDTLPDTFHYVGPLRSPIPHPIPFPWERLTGKPLVYASLGTLQGAREPLFRAIADACRGLDVQLVISHGGRLKPDEAASLPGEPLVVGYAPQNALLEKATLTITHAGLNTALDSMAAGVPLVTIPITFEQPAIARRVEWTGSGCCVPLSRAKPHVIRRAVIDVLERDSYRHSAQRMRAAIAAAGGVERAADLVEGALASTARGVRL